MNDRWLHDDTSDKCLGRVLGISTNVGGTRVIKTTNGTFTVGAFILDTDINVNAPIGHAYHVSD